MQSYKYTFQSFDLITYRSVCGWQDRPSSNSSLALLFNLLILMTCNSINWWKVSSPTIIIVFVARASGSSDGVVVKALASHQCGLGSIPDSWPYNYVCGLSLLLVLYSAQRGFSLGSPVFPSPQKTAFLNSNLIRYRASLKTTFE